MFQNVGYLFVILRPKIDTNPSILANMRHGRNGIALTAVLVLQFRKLERLPNTPNPGFSELFVVEDIPVHNAIVAHKADNPIFAVIVDDESLKTAENFFHNFVNRKPIPS